MSFDLSKLLSGSKSPVSTSDPFGQGSTGMDVSNFFGSGFPWPSFSGFNPTGPLSGNSSSGNPSAGSPPPPGQLVLRDDDGFLSPVSAAAASGSSTSLSKGTATTVAAPAPTVVGAAGGFQINLVWDTSVASAPTAFQSAVIAAAQYYASMYSNPIRINIAVGYGEVGGTKLPSGALAASQSYGYSESYATVSTALKKDASFSNFNATADATLGATDPTGKGNYFVTTAEAKALGQVSGTGTAIDGFIGLSSSYAFTYDPNNRSVAGKYDAIGAMEHEISEVMGRIGGVNYSMGSNNYTPLDLFRYASNGSRALTATTGSYFSINGGKTNLGVFNNPKNGGDAADWASSVFGNSYGYGSTGAAGLVTPNDLVEMATLGYKLSSAGLTATKSVSVA